MKSSVLRRLFDGAVAWRDRQFGAPTVASSFQRDAAWEIAQADLQPWADEPDYDGIVAAFDLCRSDDKRAHTELHRLAEAGSPRATTAIGEAYCWGRDVPQDMAEAERWFQRGYEMGSWRGLLHHGKTLFAKKDWDAAEAVFRRGAEVGFAPSYRWLAFVGLRRPWRRRTLPDARAWFELGVDAGCPVSRVCLGGLMSLGLYGLSNIRRGCGLLNEDWQAAVEAERPAASDTIH
jgi:hypothetical protein